MQFVIDNCTQQATGYTLASNQSMAGHGYPMKRVPHHQAYICTLLTYLYPLDSPGAVLCPGLNQSWSIYCWSYDKHHIGMILLGLLPHALILTLWYFIGLASASLDAVQVYCLHDLTGLFTAPRVCTKLAFASACVALAFGYVPCVVCKTSHRKRWCWHQHHMLYKYWCPYVQYCLHIKSGG